MNHSASLSLPLAFARVLGRVWIVLILHEPFQKGHVAGVPFPLDPVFLPGRPPLWEADLLMVEVTDGEDQGEGAEDDEQHPGGGGEPLRSLRLLGNA